jgi:haloacetate dehalogenase
MAADQVEVMRQLGFERFFVAGHDRGGRCAYRMALDYPDRVLKLAVLDIIPTGEAWLRAGKAFALGFWHWSFLAQPYDFPERLIGADPDYYYWRRHGPQAPSFIALEAFEDFRRCFNNPATIHAMCEDYRAGATIDFEHDMADRGKRRIQCPVLALWSGRDDLERWYDVLAVWREWADDVRGRALDCGHHLALEAPDETYAELYSFFTS